MSRTFMRCGYKFDSILIYTYYSRQVNKIQNLSCVVKSVVEFIMIKLSKSYINNLISSEVYFHQTCINERV